MRILVTNDDGIDAPALAPLADALDDLGEVQVVVPDRERSWVGKAITRFDPVSAAVVERGGRQMTAVSGYPADAVQLGIHVLGDLPDLVVSGVNLGYNHGAGFMMSSGTVGAAVEAWIAGVPSVAISTGTMGDWHAWRTRVESDSAADDWERIARLSAELVDLIGQSGLHEECDVVSVNLPYDATADTGRRITSIARVGYDKLFAIQEDGSYRHAYGGGMTDIDPVDGSDVDAAHDGVVSVTPVRMPAAALVPDGIRRFIEA